MRMTKIYASLVPRWKNFKKYKKDPLLV